MKLCELLSGVRVKKYGVARDTEIGHICSDSRCVLSGGIFICVKGTHRDGHSYIGEALSRGAVAVVVESEAELPDGVPYIAVDDTRVAEAYIWNNFYRHPAADMHLIAVTGTNGKTSCVFMLREILRCAGRRVGIITTAGSMAEDEVLGTFGGSSVSDAAGAMTTPDPEYLYGSIAMMRERGVEYLVFEASSHALSQHKTAPLHIDCAVFTNLSEEHLDYHGTMERYFAAKARLALATELLVINCDDEYMSRLEGMFAQEKRVITCSSDASSGRQLTAEVSALRQKPITLDGAEYVYFSREAVFRLKCRVPGVFTIQNSLLAATAALALGIDAVCVRDALGQLSSINGRLERVELGELGAPFEAFVDYAHTPAALEALLVSVRQLRRREQRIILLFGCGGERDRSKRRRMGDIASRLADFVIVTSDNPRGEDADEIIAEILSGLDLERPHAVIRSRREAICYAVDCARADDIVLLAGKGHEKYEIDAMGKHPFDEREILRDAVRKRKNQE